MASLRDRVYQTSDLAGAARREFLEAGVRDRAYLRTPDGESLVLTRTATLDLLSDLRDHFLSHVMLDFALRRPREDRNAADFGEWAFVAIFDDEAISEFQTEMSDAIVRALSNQDTDTIDEVLIAWRRSARAYANPTTRSLLEGALDDDDFTEVFGADGGTDTATG